MAIQASHGLLCLVAKRSFAKALAPYSRNVAGARFYQSVSAKAMRSLTSTANDLKPPEPMHLEDVRRDRFRYILVGRHHVAQTRDAL